MVDDNDAGILRLRNTQSPGLFWPGMLGADRERTNNRTPVTRTGRRTRREAVQRVWTNVLKSNIIFRRLGSSSGRYAARKGELA
jgi:hypothetical protein